MLRKMSLAACISLAAALSVVAAGAAGAQSASSDKQEQSGRPAAQPASESPRVETIAPAEAKAAAPAEPQAVASEPKTASPAEAKTVAPAEAKAPAPAEAKVAAPAEPKAAAPVETKTASPAEPTVASPVETRAGSPTEAKTAAPVETKTASPAEPTVGPPVETKAGPASEATVAAPTEAKTAAPDEAKTLAPAATETVVELDPVVAEVRQQLAASKLPDSTTAERDALKAFYAERRAPVWVSATDGLTQRARHAMAEIANAGDWGLEAKAFTLPAPALDDMTPATLAKAEITLSVAVLKYARYARGGRLEPSRVSRNFDQELSLRDPKVVLETVAGVETPGSYLRSLHPKHPQFELLRQALLKLRAGAGKPTAKTVRLPAGPLLKPGVEHPDVALLRQRLKLASAPGSENVYDEAVQEAVTEYQRKNGMVADGIVGPRTRASLNGEGGASAFGSKEQRLIINMERWRWMPEDLGELHVWDNIPEYRTRVVKDGQWIHQAKIIVGKRETQTTIFSANMRYVVFGPEWGVPNSIKIKEILPYLRPSYETNFFGFGGYTDTSVLERHNLHVSYNGRPVDASQIDWSRVDIRKYSFVQPSGPGNVLGAIKFRFPNKHAIYMHDTPQRELFNQSVRMFSHGCIRVHNPGQLAEVLLGEDKGWSAAHVRRLLAQGGNNQVALTKEIPVHITYFTMVADKDGTVHSFADIYGLDKRVAAALAGRPLPLERPAVDTLPTAQEDLRQARRERYKQAQEDLFSGLFGN